MVIGSPLHLLVPLFVIVALVVIVMTNRARKQGGWLLSELPPLADETIALEQDLEFSAMPPRMATAVHVSLVFMRARVRVTNRRVVVAQPALFRPDQLVLRHVIHLSRETKGEGATLYVQSVLDRQKSGRAMRNDRPELRLATDPADVTAPEYVALRGEGVEKVAAALGLPFV